MATKDSAVVLGKYGVPARGDKAFSDLRVGDYDLVLLPGGHEAPDRVRQEPSVLKFIGDMHRAGKLVAALCHGPWILISAGIMRGKRATCYIGMADDLKNAGAHYEETSVVEDDNIITSPHYRYNGDFMKAILAKF